MRRPAEWGVSSSSARSVSTVSLASCPSRRHHRSRRARSTARPRSKPRPVVARLAPSLGLEYTIVRPTIVYGPGDTNGMLDKLAAMLRARRYRLVGSGENTLHHTHVDDVVRGVLTLAESAGAVNEHFIVAGPETITLRRLGELVARAVGVEVPRVRIPLRLARLAASCIDLATSRGLAFTKREPPINNEKLDVMTVPIAFDPIEGTRRGLRTSDWLRGRHRAYARNVDEVTEGPSPAAPPRRSWTSRVLRVSVAVAALCFVAYVVPLRDQCGPAGCDPGSLRRSARQACRRCSRYLPSTSSVRSSGRRGGALCSGSPRYSCRSARSGASRSKPRRAASCCPAESAVMRFAWRT